MAALDAHSIIMEELGKVDGQKRYVKTRIMIQCPFHDERTPSCGVVTAEDGRYELGSYNCLGCGTHGNWNSLAEKLGLQKIGNLVAKKGAARTDGISVRLKEMRSNMMSMKKSSMRNMMEALGSPAYTEWPTSIEWREYPGWLIHNIGAFIGSGGKGRGNTIHEVNCYLPIVIGDEIVGVVKALTQKIEGKLSYISSDGDWVKEKGLFPYHYVSAMLDKMKGDRYVVIVEGPRDALRLILNGIPALAVLGSQNLSTKKLKMIGRLLPEIVYVLPDNDRAGKEMNKKFKWYSDNKKISYPVECLDLPRDKDENGKLIKMDPDNMPDDILLEIYELIKENGGRRLKKNAMMGLTCRIK